MGNHNYFNEDELNQEKKWIAAAKQNPKNFSPLYDKHFEVIFNYIYRRTGEESLTSDLTSQTFLKALQNLKKYQFKGIPFSAWLFKIASNEINKYYNSTKKRVKFSLEESRFREILEETTEKYDENIKNKMIKALEDLPSDMLLALEFRYFEEKSFKEIAYILDVSESGAKMRIYRALEKLRLILKIERT
ncbi:MAG: sigma-70 family RNA polymerase sigma factor [Bacteroidetes bacterium]|nr:sigma-70 family RNA polymerase sigma factor [Bacteroidota bacterium]